MSRGTDDLGLQHPSIPTGGTDGVQDLVTAMQNSTVEVKNLLTNECVVLLECRYCKNIFRSKINFLTHKRQYCRALHASIAPAFTSVAYDFAQNALSGSQTSGERSNIKGESSASSHHHQQQQQQNPNKSEAGSSSGTKNESQQHHQQPKRAKGILKRTNLVSVLNKHTQHYALSLPNSEHKLELHTLPRISRAVPTTTFRNGQQVIETFPQALVTKDKIPSDRVPVVIPQDNSSRYREMNLRNRKGDSSKNGVARTVGPEEIEILERMSRHQTSMLVDLSTLTCSHSDCKEKLPFSSLYTLAYHLTVKHNRRSSPVKQIPCYLCDFESQTYPSLIEHVKIQHGQYYLEHTAARIAVEDLKRGRKGKQAKVAPVRGRSLSPLSDDFIESEESIDGSADGNVSEGAPTLEAMMDMEVDVENAQLKSKDKKDTKEKTKSKIGESETNKNEAKEYGEPLVSFKKVSEIEWAVKNRMEFMVASVSGDAQKAETLENTTFQSDTRTLHVDPPSKNQTRTKGRSRNGNGKTVQPPKVTTAIKKKKHNQPAWLRSVRKSASVGNVSQGQTAGPCKEQAAQESDEEMKQEPESESAAKKRGRARKVRGKIERPLKNQFEKEELSGNSDEAEDAARKQRPSRHRRKPNWIDENFVTGFRSKRPRRNDMDEDEAECEGRSSKGQSPSNGARPSSSTGSKGAKSGNSSQRSTPVDSNDAKGSVKSDVSSEETSNSSTPGRQQSPGHAGTSGQSVVDDNAVRVSAPLSGLGSMISALVNPGSTIKDGTSKKTCRLQYTPRARRMKYGDDPSNAITDDEDGPSTSSVVAASDALGQSFSSGVNASTSGNDGRSTTQSRRKQDLSAIRENTDNEVMIVRYSNGEASLPKDLSEIPVYLTETQRDLFFSFIRPASPSSDGATSAHKCMQCGDIIANISEGRRHAVSHLRIMRLRCSLCDCGSFFCSDMRTHLQYRHCEKLHLAPKGYVAPGNIVPCMSQRQADDLTKVVDPMKPGRVMYTSGKIISSTNPKPYYPDPVIERRVLGTLLPEINLEQSQSTMSTTNTAIEGTTETATAAATTAERSH